MDRHAFLIIAHKIDSVLITLMKSIDASNHDIYLHIDKKSKDIHLNQLDGVCLHSHLYVSRIVQVAWGGDTQIKVEYALLGQAMSQGGYDYFHLLSGSDLMLVSTSKFDEFFSANKGKIFVRMEKERFEYQGRVRYYYPLQNTLGRNADKNFANKCILFSQKLVRVHRNKDVKFQKGSQWFSIEKNFAEYLLAKKEWVKKIFHNTLCCDELFVQTVLINSPYADSLYCKEYNDSCKMNMRYIDWKRGNPYVFTKEDYDELMQSGCLFARKFDETKDREIIEMIFKSIKDESSISSI